MKKTDIVQRSANDNCWTHGVPAINVKWYPYLPDIEKKFRGATDTSSHICKVCSDAKFFHPKPDHKFKPGGTHFVHEYSDDTAFWGWFDRLDHPNGEFTIAEQIARDSGWEDAKELACELFSGAFKVYSSGRSGGWLTVHGLEPIEDWDAVAVKRWERFSKGVAEILDDLDYRFLWHLAVNVMEAEQRNAYAYYQRLAS